MSRLYTEDDVKKSVCACLLEQTDDVGGVVLIARKVVSRLRKIEKPKAFERKVWSDKTVEQMSKPGATWQLRDDLTVQTSHYSHPITVTYRERAK